MIKFVLSIAMMSLPINALAESGVADGKGLICSKENYAPKEKGHLFGDQLFFFR
ncbi:MAG: hypothetical protein VX363_03340 [Pseudomonadota bacterium]